VHPATVIAYDREVNGHEFVLRRRAGMSEHKMRWQEVGLFLLFGCVVAALYHNSLNSFWLYDDPYLLRNAAAHRLLAFFTKPEVWNLVGLSYLTPWQTLSLGLDYRLFGLDSRLFYAHHLISLWLASCVFYAALRLWWRPFPAASGVFLFLVSAPAAAAAEMLMIRHYIEGLLLCAAALYFFVKAVRENSVGLSLASAVFYLFSMSAKEIYVPALMAFAVLPEGQLRTRIRALILPATAFIVYFMWRNYMLDGVVTSAGKDLLLNSIKDPDRTLQLLRKMYDIALLQVGVSRLTDIARPLFAILFLLSATSSGVFLLKKKNYAAMIFHVVLFLSVYVLPLSLVSPFSAHDLIQYRFVLLLSAYNCGIFISAGAYVHEHIKRKEKPGGRHGFSRTTAVVFTASALVVCMNSFLWAKDMRKTELRPLVEEGRFFMTAGPDSLLVKSQPVWAAPSYFDSLEFFKQFAGGGMGALAIYGPFAFVENPEAPELEGKKAFRYDAKKGAMIDITEVYRKERREYLSRVKELPLKVRLHIERSAIDYSIVSAAGEKCFALLGYRPNLYCMMLSASEFRTGPLNTSLKMNMRFGCESKAGDITFSPEWVLDFSAERDIAWERR
jgi:hypothetical protein